jgi:hypothetical protein
MAGWPDLTGVGDCLDLNTVPLNAGGAFCALNAGFMAVAGAKKHSNVALSDTDGLVGRRGARGQRVGDLKVLVRGDVDADTGDLVTDRLTGCRTNLDWLRARTVDAAEDDFGCVPARLVRRTGLVLVGGVQLDDWGESDIDLSGQALVMIRVVVPTALLEETP